MRSRRAPARTTAGMCDTIVVPRCFAPPALWSTIDAGALPHLPAHTGSQTRGSIGMRGAPHRCCLESAIPPAAGPPARSYTRSTTSSISRVCSAPRGLLHAAFIASSRTLCVRLIGKRITCSTSRVRSAPPAYWLRAAFFSSSHTPCARLIGKRTTSSTSRIRSAPRGLLIARRFLLVFPHPVRASSSANPALATASRVPIVHFALVVCSHTVTIPGPILLAPHPPSIPSRAVSPPPAPALPAAAAPYRRRPVHRLRRLIGSCPPCKHA